MTWKEYIDTLDDDAFTVLQYKKAGAKNYEAELYCYPNPLSENLTGEERTKRGRFGVLLLNELCKLDTQEERFNKYDEILNTLEYEKHISNNIIPPTIDSIQMPRILNVEIAVMSFINSEDLKDAMSELKQWKNVHKKEYNDWINYLYTVD